MIAWDKILSELVGVVGWRQSTITGDVEIDDTNLASSSGLFIQGAHQLITVKNIKATQENSSISDDDMNILLANLVKDGISNVLNHVFPSNDVFASGLLYKYESDFNTPLTQLKGFVGFEITIANRPDIVSILNKIILQFNGSDSVKLLLFNSGLKAPISNKSISVTADTNISAALDWILGYITAPGGVYYLGYLNSALSSSAYDRTLVRSGAVYDSSSMGPNLMTAFNSILFKSVWVKDWNSETMFNTKDVVYRSESWGMNVDVTTARDYSNVILMNKDRFAKAIQLSTVAKAIEMMTSTSRINPEERVIMNALDKKILVDSPATYNLYSSLEKELKSLTDLFAQNRMESYTLR